MSEQEEERARDVRRGALARAAAARRELDEPDVDLLVSLMWIAIVVTAISQAAEILSNGLSYVLVPGAVAASITLVLIRVLRSGRWLRQVAYGYILMMWVSIAVPVALYGGVNGSINTAFIGNVLVAVSVMGSRVGYLMAGLSVTYLVVLYFVETAGILPPPAPVHAVGNLVIFSGIIIAAGLVVARALARADAMAHRLQTSATELEDVIEERTRNLQAVNARLIDENKRRQATEDALRRARNEAEAAAEARSTFLANMSHEIRTPMNAVVAGASLLEGAELPTEARELAAAVSTGARALLDVVNDVLDLNKLEAGAVRLTLEVCRPKDVLEDVRRLFAPLAQEKGLELSLEVDGELELPLHVDVGRLRQVVANLVGNAVKFTDRGQVTVSAKLAIPDGSQPHLCVDVIDTGPGIPLAQQDAVFEAFTQADPSLSRRHAGSGLGLAICRELVELMGGDLGLASEAGEGARFSFWVPVERVELKDEPSRPELRSELAGLKVLVAEDTELNRMLTCRYLEMLGVRADLATNGEEALKAASSTSYDVILMDLHMPVMDGFEAARRIQEEGMGRPRIVAFTADMMSEAELRARSSAIEGVISKPITEDSLRRALAGEPAARGAMS